MGGKESKQFPISFDEASKRVTDSERRRLQDAFRRLSASAGFITRQVFIHDCLGDGVPVSLAEQIYGLCGGNSRGLNFKETLTVLVLITRGTHEEKIKFIYGLLATESGMYIEKSEMVRLVMEWENGYIPEPVAMLFADGEKVNFNAFSSWIESQSECLGISRWLLFPNSNLSLTNKLDTPTFYQTLAGVTHLEEQEIVELEKRFWTLVGNSNSGQVDVDIIRPLVSPPLPASLVDGFFSAFDENHDGHIDFKELSCGVSAACRGPEMERQKFCFKIFDLDSDGFLNQSEVAHMLECMIEVRNQTLADDKRVSPNVKKMTQEVLNKEDKLSVEDFLVWTVDNPYPTEFSRLLFQICHIVLGLRPMTRRDEGNIVRGWLEREERAPLMPGAVWHLLNMEWWSSWHVYVNHQESGDSRVSSSTKKTSPSLDSTLAMDSAPTVIATSYLQLNSDHASSRNSSRLATPSGSPQSSRKNSMTAPPPSRPGAIDNSSLILSPSYKVTSLTGEGGKLKNSVKLTRGKDFEVIPERLWKALMQWYGGSPSLPRQVIRNKHGKVELELYPFSIKLFKHQTINRPNHVPTVVGGYSAAALHASSSTYGSSIPSTTTRRFHAYQGAFSRRTAISQIAEFLCQRLHIKPEDMRLWHFREEANMRLLEDESLTLEEAGFKDEESLLIEVRSRDGTWPEEISSLCGDRRASMSMNSNNVPGITGLNNLGNTCYMNAALQCVANTRILAQYFNTNCHLFELNRTNPLGMKGHIAKRYGDLVREMWSTSTRTIAPIKLRWTIGRYRPHFSGFQQQDSQELLAFLLDGLHEDLNRVQDKPYVELKDSDGRSDTIVAQEAWENHIVRNKSIIVDLFHGQLKSKVICKVCGHESVRFDPFTYLSLPLPMENTIHLEVIVIRQDGTMPRKYGLTLDSETRYTNVKNYLSHLCKIPPQNLILVDIVQSQFRVMPMEEQKLKNMNGSCIFAYEVYTLNLPMALNAKQPCNQTFSDIQRSTASKPSSATSTLDKKVNGNAVVRPEEGNEAAAGLHPEQETPESMNHKSDKEALLTARATEVLENKTHSRQGSASSSSVHSSESLSYELGDCRQGIIVGLHRKMIPQEVYFLSTEKYRPVLFGLPLIVPCTPTATYLDLYKSVWLQISRLVSPLPPRETTHNHATDCDDSLGYEYPFVLKVVQRGGAWCAWCPWHRFCRGCALPCTDQEFGFAASFLAIDWDQTALHLRYLSAQEKAFIEDPSVSESQRASTEPITLNKCLEAFTREEELGQDEKYYCSSCKTHQLASKKLQIWRLPPVLIVHLKRFHYLNGRWIKSHKIVDFPLKNLDPTDYLAAVPAATLRRHKELRRVAGKMNFSKCNGSTIMEVDSSKAMGDHKGVEEEPEEEEVFGGEGRTIFSPKFGRRTRLESTSLQSNPVKDDNLQDFHQHKLENPKDPLDINYNMYAMVCHSGVLGGGHYISYCKTTEGKWYCHNDSTCKEIKEEQMDKATAYMLFYERESLSVQNYLPHIKGSTPDTQDLDDELELDFKKQCSVM